MKDPWISVAFLVAILMMGGFVGLAWSQWNEPGRTDKKPRANVQRFGSVIGLKRDKADEYIKLHANVWPEIQNMIKKRHIRNYSIFLGELDDGNLYLFSFFEYTGDDFDADMKRMADDPKTRQWWAVTDPCQIPQKNRAKGEQWMQMREVFHLD